MPAHPGSGEVYVVTDALFASALQQAKQRGSFVSSSSAPDHNYAMMRLRWCKMKKVVPVTGKQHGITLVGKLEDGFIWRVAGKDVTQERHMVPELLQQIT